MKALQFFKEVKLEATKISWPTRKELVPALILVVAMSVVAGLFFFVVDSLIYKIVQFVLGI